MDAQLGSCPLQFPRGHGNQFRSGKQKVQASGGLYILTRKASHREGGEEMPPVTDATKAKAEVYYGDETCREKFALLLAEMGLPDCLLTVLDIEECGYVKDTGFVWLRHKKKREYYKFEETVISYDAVITAYFQPNKIKNLTGVKAREFLIWINLTEICVEEGDDSPSPSGFITFKTLAGLSKSFPLSLFGGIRAQTLVFRDDVDGSKEENWCKKLKL